MESEPARVIMAPSIGLPLGLTAQSLGETDRSSKASSRNPGLAREPRGFRDKSTGDFGRQEMAGTAKQLGVTLETRRSELEDDDRMHIDVESGKPAIRIDSIDQSMRHNRAMAAGLRNSATSLFQDASGKPDLVTPDLGSYVRKTSVPGGELISIGRFPAASDDIAVRFNEERADLRFVVESEFGSHYDVVVQSEDNVGTKVVMVRDPATDQPKLRLRYVVNNSGRWKLDVGAAVPGATLPAEATVMELGVFGFVAAAIVDARRLRAQSGPNTPTGPRVPGDAVCINHDLECTLGGLGKFYLMVDVPCKGRVVVDGAQDCCREHDIHWWCASNYAEKMAADAEVAACMGLKALETIYQELPWWCWIVLTPPAIGVLALLLSAAFTLLVTLILWIGAHDWKGTGLIGGGHEANSCLCGGDVPTYQCDHPEDGLLCDRPPVRHGGSGEACYECYYYMHPTKHSCFLQTDPTGKCPECCPGTQIAPPPGMCAPPPPGHPIVQPGCGIAG